MWHLPGLAKFESDIELGAVAALEEAYRVLCEVRYCMPDVKSVILQRRSVEGSFG